MRQFNFNEWGRGHRRANLFSSLIILAVIVLLGAGCGDGGDDPVITDDPQPPGGGFSISAPGVVDSRVQLEVGRTLQFTPSNAVYTSSNRNAASITNSGLLTGVTAGQETVISATNASGVPSDNTVRVTVVDRSVPVSLLVDVRPLTVEVGLGGEARVSATYADGSIQDLSSEVARWESSGPEITVNSTGAFGGNSVGFATLRPVFSDTSLNSVVSPSVPIRVRGARSEVLRDITIEPATLPILGGTDTFEISLSRASESMLAFGTFAPSDPSELIKSEVFWDIFSDDSQNPIGQISADGIFVPLNEGTGIIFASRSNADGTEIIDTIQVRVLP